MRRLTNKEFFLFSSAAIAIASKRRNYSRGLCGKCQENAGLNVAFNRNGSISVQPGKEIFKSGE